MDVDIARNPQDQHSSSAESIEHTPELPEQTDSPQAPPIATFPELSGDSSDDEQDLGPSRYKTPIPKAAMQGLVGKTATLRMLSGEDVDDEPGSSSEEEISSPGEAECEGSSKGKRGRKVTSTEDRRIVKRAKGTGKVIKSAEFVTDTDEE